MKTRYMKSLIKIFSLAFALILEICPFTYSQKIIISDMNYVLDRDVELEILKNSNEEGLYIYEILTPRKYINNSQVYTSANVSDILLFCESPEGKIQLNIFVLNDDLNSHEFRTVLTDLSREVVTSFLEKNLIEEGFVHAIKKLNEYLSKCKIQLTTPQNHAFTPGIDDSKLEIAINSSCNETKYIRVEVYSNETGAEPQYSEIRKFSSLVDGKLYWDGKVSGKEYSFIRAADAPLSVRISLSDDELFRSYSAARVEIDIDKTVDEWNRHKKRFEGFIVKEAGYTGTNYQFYAHELRSLMKETIPAQYLTDDRCPLDYMDENLVTISFLNLENFLTHQSFGKILTNVKSRLMQKGVYEELKLTNPVNGSFALRKIANRKTMSPHSLACAIDIDPERNPHIKDSWGQEVFGVIYHITTVNMYNNKPSIDQLKSANRIFKATFNDDFVKDLQAQKNQSIETLDYIIVKMKYEGSFDWQIKSLIEEFHTTADLYYKLIPAVSDNERKLEQEYLDKMKSLREEARQLSNAILNYLQNAPSFSFFSEIKEKIETDKRILLSKVELILSAYDKTSQLGIYSSLAPLNTEHSKNIVTNLASTLTPARMEEMQELITSVNNQLSLLRKYSATGFFELHPDLVNAFLEEPKIRWGGHYNAEKDFMHFELYPLKDNL